jgi:TetR/AcrR family transcriptional repressor of mexJK operon
MSAKSPDSLPLSLPEVASKPPRKSKKRMAIVEAARALFCDEGYPGTSMDAIAAAAGVSKATVYAHFPSKQHLFSEVLSDVTDAYIRLSEEVYDAPLEEGMTVIATRFIEMITRPASLTIFRTIITQGQDFPDMVEVFRAAGPRKVIAAVATYFRIQSEKGVLSVPDPTLAATIFLHAVKGEAHARALSTCISSYPNTQIIAEIVRVMIKAYAPEPKTTP